MKIVNIYSFSYILNKIVSIFFWSFDKMGFLDYIRKRLKEHFDDKVIDWIDENVDQGSWQQYKKCLFSYPKLISA